MRIGFNKCTFYQLTKTSLSSCRTRLEKMVGYTFNIFNALITFLERFKHKELEKLIPSDSGEIVVESNRSSRFDSSSIELSIACNIFSRLRRKPKQLHTLTQCHKFYQRDLQANGFLLQSFPSLLKQNQLSFQPAKTLIRDFELLFQFETLFSNFPILFSLFRQCGIFFDRDFQC